ncbi:MAG: PilZ domain-containing protein [Saprospiraceae bacterium]|nr:PilZ domain-containing protein [Pyrinomonadaceae bacterium]
MSSTLTEKDNRRIQRFALALPTRIEVQVDEKFAWNEVTRLEDVSGFGAAFVLKRPVKRGRLLVISAPMPRQLRCFDYLEPQYRIWGLVRRCIAVGDNPAARTYAIGIAFIGKNPPQGYLENPSRLYELAPRDDGGLWQIVEAEANPDETDLPVYLRRHSRFSIPEALLLELLDENGDVAASEVSVTENLSLGGAAVFTSFNVDIGSFLRVKSERHDITIISVVRGKRVGADGIVRLHLEFIDHLFPLEGIGVG